LWVGGEWPGRIALRSSYRLNPKSRSSKSEGNPNTESTAVPAINLRMEGLPGSTGPLYCWLPCVSGRTLFGAPFLPKRRSEPRMGRSYWFECPRCGYRAKVSGRADRGLDLFVQTILCRDCKELYDAVTRLRVTDKPAASERSPGWSRSKRLDLHRASNTPPSFQSELNRLPRLGADTSGWLRFDLQCPVSALHRVQAWNEPDKCPKCRTYLEKNAIPFRIWE